MCSYDEDASFVQQLNLEDLTVLKLAFHSFVCEKAWLSINPGNTQYILYGFKMYWLKLVFHIGIFMENLSMTATHSKYLTIAFVFHHFKIAHAQVGILVIFVKKRNCQRLPATHSGGEWFPPYDALLSSLNCNALHSCSLLGFWSTMRGMFLHFTQNKQTNYKQPTYTFCPKASQPSHHAL